ncbi:MAG: zinc ABC transporter substrate-binding protein [Bacillota bacterium]|nr:zinc ABC transporter substrate-binding protein [Bacillota bacterium]
MKKSIILLCLLLPLSLFLAACTNETQHKAKNQLSIYTTVFPLQYFSERIGGKFVNVKTVYPPGADEHTFEPSQQDMMNLADSDLFFYIGLGLEGFVEKAKDTLKDQNVTIIPVANSLILPKTNTQEETGTDINPHVWLDPIYCKDMAAIIRDALIKKMPKNKALFNANYNNLSKELDDLNAQYKTTISQAKTKKIIVTHAAFGYWENRYGLKQISISGLSTTNEPSQKQLENIVSNAKQEGLHYILFEQNVNSKLGKVVQDEIGAKALIVNNLAVLTPKNIKDNETYFTLMNKNLHTLKIALNK